MVINNPSRVLLCKKVIKMNTLQKTALKLDLLVFNANFSSISAISWHEQIVYIKHLQNP
jgi:hypothetical protein